MTRLVPMLLVLCSLAPSVNASDLEKEKRWADQIVDFLIIGEAEWLDADGQQFLSIYTEAADGPGKRAAIVLHGIGVHPNWQQVIYPLRTMLPDEGWSTLSLQLPILPNEADVKDYAPLMDEVAPRIDAGIAFLREQGAEDIVIVAHSLGASMATDYLAGGERDVKAFVGIGMSDASGAPRLSDSIALAKIRIPVLDLYGSEDLPEVLVATGSRADAGRQAGNEHFVQREVPGANHFFDGQDTELVGIVADWLDGTVTSD
jgi:pimeloyl-ACP methyl ester carboxylesterase